LEQQHIQILASSTRILNLGYELRTRLDAVAAAEQLDGTALGRRIIEAAVTAREQAAGSSERAAQDE
jgi:hypothetical protein